MALSSFCLTASPGRIRCGGYNCGEAVLSCVAAASHAATSRRLLCLCMCSCGIVCRHSLAPAGVAAARSRKFQFGARPVLSVGLLRPKSKGLVARGRNPASKAKDTGCPIKPGMTDKGTTNDPGPITPPSPRPSPTRGEGVEEEAVCVSKTTASYAAISWRLRAWLRPGPANSIWGRGLFERSEFRSPHHRDRGKGTRRATPGRRWFWVLLPKQKDLGVWGRTPTSFPSSCGGETPQSFDLIFTADSGRASVPRWLRPSACA